MTRRVSSSAVTGVGARPGGFSADVDDVRAVGDETPHVRDRIRGRKKLPPSLKLSGVTFRMPTMIGRSSTISCEPARHRRGSCRAGPLARQDHAGATSGPPNSGGFAGFGCASAASFTAAGGIEGGAGRGGNVSPRASI